MVRERVILLIYHGKGHLNATLGVAKILAEQYDVIFAGFPVFKNYIEGQGFPYFPLNTLPFGLGFERWLNIQEKKNLIPWQVLKDRFTDRLHYLRAQELYLMTDTIKPQYILIDAWQSTDFIALYPKLKETNVKVGFIQTMLSTRMLDDKPPLNSAADISDQAVVQRTLSESRKKKRKKKLIDKIRFLGMDTDAMIKRRIRLNRIPDKYVSRDASVFAPVFNHVPEFILMPREFDYPNSDALPHQHFVGSLIDHDRIETVDEKWTTYESEIFRLSQICPLIYCSFGSLPLEKEVAAIQDLLSSLEHLAMKNDYVCVVSSGNKAISNLKSAANNNVFYFQHVPQLRILQQANLFITHGGLNSIKEAIDAGVPMLVYPVNKDYDLPGNAARVAYHQLGLMLDVEKFDETAFRNKISELFSNDVYKRNIVNFRNAEKKYTGENFMSLFLRLTPVD
jgi:zeaxanthin glucosyltransferase